MSAHQPEPSHAVPAPRAFRPRLVREIADARCGSSPEASLRVATDVASFVEEPVRAWVAGERWLVCCPEPSLVALVAWGAISRRDAEQVMSTFAADLAMGPHTYVIDARRLGPVPDPDAFSTVLERLAPRWELYRGHVARCAVILPPGMTAAVIRGFFEMAPAPFETRFYLDPLSALEWAGDAEPAGLLARLDRLQEEVSGTPPVLFHLRALLDRDPGGTHVGALARKLGVSTRSLQRELEKARTGFRQELSAARLRKAQELLARTTSKITAIALEVGCASSQHLSALFRRLTGESPTSWRARHCAVGQRLANAGEILSARSP